MDAVPVSTPRVDAGSVLVPLTKGEFAIIDEGDLELVSGKKWRLVSPKPSVRYAMHRSVSMHRLILGLSAGDPDVDHKNFDGLDNRRSNIRLASKRQNAAHCRKYRTKKQPSSEFKGVYKRLDKRTARFVLRFQNRYVASFATEIEAALAYDTLAKEAYGEFAMPNFK